MFALLCKNAGSKEGRPGDVINGGAPRQHHPKKNKITPALVVAKSLPQGFIAEGGWIKYDTGEVKNGKKNYAKLCAEFSVVALIRDKNNMEWRSVADIVDKDSVIHRIILPNDINDCIRILREMKVKVQRGRGIPDKMGELLDDWDPGQRALRVDHGGWSEDGSYYVLGEDTFGSLPNGEEVVYENLQKNNIFQVSGTLEDWQRNVGDLCKGNSRYVFGVSAAIAGCLLRFAGNDGFGFHFCGKSSKGKTTLVQVAGSVCGGKPGSGSFVRTWRITDNALEGVAAQHNDNLLVLDEGGQASPKTLEAAGYMLSNGEGKGRAYTDGTARDITKWQVLVLSTGEPTFAQLLRQNGIKVQAGHTVRMVDIPTDAGSGLGAFENIHGRKDAAAFASEIKANALLYYGTVLRAILQRLTVYGADIIREMLKHAIEMFMECLPEDADGQAKRVCEHFAVVAVAGEFGIRERILPWEPGQAKEASMRCFNEWITHRGGYGNHERIAGMKAVAAFFGMDAKNHFTDYLLGDNGITLGRHALPSGRKEYGEIMLVEDNPCYVMKKSVFSEEICKGYPADDVLEELQKRGLLLAEADKLTKRVYLASTRQRSRFIVIKTNIKHIDLV